MKRSAKIGVAALLLVSPLAAAAQQDVQLLTFDEALTITCTNNPALKASA